jgi:hypothetical protein
VNAVAAEFSSTTKPFSMPNRKVASLWLGMPKAVCCPEEAGKSLEKVSPLTNAFPAASTAIPVPAS